MQAQGSLGTLKIQMESAFKTTPANPKAKLVYFSGESLSRSQAAADSKLIRGSSRHPLKSVRGKVDVGGGINSELISASALYYAALGSMESAMTGGTMGTALTTPTAVIDAVNQIMTITATSHGIVTGDSVEIAALTAPTTLNGKIFPVVSVTSVNVFVIRIPLGTTTTYTIGSGTIKKVTAVGTTLTHTLKAGGNLPSYCIEKGFTDVNQFFKYLGCKCSSLGLSINADGLIDISTNWLGASETVAQTSFDTAAAIDNLAYGFDNLGIAAADIKEGGVAIAQILSVDGISIENTLDGDTFVVGGAGSRAGITAGTYRVSGTVKAIFEDVVLYNKAINGTESSIDVTWKRGTGAGTAGNESLQLVIPELTFQAKTPTINDGGGVIVELAFTGCYEDGADVTALKMVLKNVCLPGQMI